MTNAPEPLKPCPFCGCSGEWLYTFNGSVHGQNKCVMCKNCNGFAPSIEIWNQRSPMAEVVEIMENLNK